MDSSWQVPMQTLTRVTRLARILILTVSSSLFATEIPEVAPDQVGLSAEHLEKIGPTVTGLIDSNRLVGASVIIARHGKIAYFQTFGQQDREAHTPMTRDTIFRIYSMSKAITSLATLMLVEQGQINLDDVISDHLPEFADVKIWTPNGLVRPQRLPTIHDMLCHASGLVDGGTGNSPVHKLYQAAKPYESASLAEMSQRISQLPLLFEPGTDWTYSFSMDMLGRIIEIKTGVPFDTFLKQQIFLPLDMKDTGFVVPHAKANRFATVYNSDQQGTLTLRAGPKKARFRNQPNIPSGGGGLVSTQRDYLRFLQLVANGGELYGTRLLKPETVQWMTTNQLSAEAMPVSFGAQVRTGVGHGLGFAVCTRKTPWDPAMQTGEYGWGGAASTHYWTSPEHDLIVITMEQTMPHTFLLENALKDVIYKAVQD